MLSVKSKPFWIIVFGTMVWSLVMVKSGLKYSYGMGFWGPNGHDGVWHLALSQSLVKGSLAMPIFSGEKIQNYHIGFDALLALLTKVTGISAVNLYFQILPVILAAGVGITVYGFVKAWRKSESEAIWAVIFTYFSTSWGWLIAWIRYHSWGGESMFWSQQSVSTLLNPPFALSLVILFGGLWCLLKKKYPWAIVLFGLLGFIKIYAGILLLGGLFLAGTYEFVINRKSKWLVVWLGALILSILFFLPLNKSSGRVIVWQPGWFLETMMAVSDRANWPKYYQAMINYRAAQNLPKAILAYFIAAVIFILGNIGIRIAAMFRKPEISGVSILLTTISVVGFLMPLFFLQRGTAWNTIQFTYYSLIIVGIFAGINWSRLKPKFSIILFILLVGPGVWGTVKQYLPERPPAMISNMELSALDFLSRQPLGTVLSIPFDKAKADEAQPFPPRPLYRYESTGYVSAFSGQPGFLEDEVNLNITGYDWPARRNKVLEFFKTQDQSLANIFLTENNIRYVYLVAGERPALGESQLHGKEIFSNSEVTIWQIN